ncbi:MAG: glycerate kinase [Daejeonella sp.]|uniref:glycerate kinase n=1 Tax=Daejeonella sp. TaxID=2805397 RepID=UPI003C762ECE
MHILVAPNAFKNSLTAPEVADAVSQGLHNSRLSCTTECFPVGDGGDGTAALIINKFNGITIEVQVRDPLNRMVNATFGLIYNGATAVIEMADASGIKLLSADEINPLKTSSVGTGELILAALDKGVSKIIIGLGGSATVDGGAGMLSALGVKFLDVEGQLLYPSPEHLLKLDKIDTSELDPRLARCSIIVLCDVDNQLLGSQGSAAVFGPQKGAKDLDVALLEGILTKISGIAAEQNGKPMGSVKHGGAAGGVAAALYSFCNAELVAGAEYFLKMTNFMESLAKCDLVITGEGSLDEQTLNGKAPFAVALLAKQLHIPVIGIAGRVPLIKSEQLDKHFDVLMPIGHEPANLQDAFKDTEANLIRTGTLIGNLYSLSSGK